MDVEARYRPSVYIETSVVSYLAARMSSRLVTAAHQQVTAEWWERVLPLFRGHVSALVVEEASRGDPAAAKTRLDLLARFPLLELTPETTALAERYFARCRLPDKARADAYHLAIAAMSEMDYMVSWNFAHILAAPIRRIVQEINAAEGITTPVICTPEELMEAWP